VHHASRSSVWSDPANGERAAGSQAVEPESIYCRALARSLRTGGDVIELPRRPTTNQARPLVLLCDVSGSMERYSRMLLHFAHALTTAATRRGISVLDRTDADHHAIARSTNQRSGERVSRPSPIWSGGTRIGAAIRQFHQHGPAARCADTRGAPHFRRVDRAIPRCSARRSRGCSAVVHRLIWLNPLIGNRGL
jgi:uncharacterized protein with von Willebrand factor type A (vWA) domain